MRRSLFLILVFSIVFASGPASASGIREFDLKTVQRLGVQLARASQRPDRGTNTPVRKRARATAIAALQGKLFKVPYDYLVLDDPDGSGFLVYALAQSRNKVVLGGHLRVTVSADGEKVERVDALSNTLLFAPPAPAHLKGEKPFIVSMSQIVSNKPLETCVYTSLHDKVIVSVGMVNDNAKVWIFVGDKIFEVTPQMIKQMEEDSKTEKKK